jgi:hypothetical protein
MAQSKFADLIQGHIEELTAAWVNSVRADPRIHSDDDLSENGLRDHIPACIEEMCALLRAGEHPNLINTREARVHSYLRFRQRYRGRELVRELSLLRMTLLDHLARSVHTEGYVEATQVINLYIDEEMSYAVSVYAEAHRTGEPNKAGA